MNYPAYTPPIALRNGLAMTLYIATKGRRTWQNTVSHPQPIYQAHVFQGAGNVPIFGQLAIPATPRGTIIATYGITGSLEDQWLLNVLGCKAFAQAYALVFFDWRAHGKTAELSPSLTSDGIYEGEDFVRIAAQAKALGCPAPYWLIGYSLGGQLALWAIKAAQTLPSWGPDLNLAASEIGGGAVICPSLESNRSLRYLTQSLTGRQLEQSIARELKKLAWRIHEHHPQALDPAAIERVHDIWSFDHELVIQGLGFASVEAYYTATSGLYQLPTLQKPTLIIYAADDPMFDPALVAELESMCAANAAIDLLLTPQGGHVGYFNSPAGQRQAQDPDPWWAWNRILDWCDRQSTSLP
ncbi:MAG: alpha/beta fold hydrolase [Leptolyngbyaceae cyanobacterium bins.349]|nr:alpha/beta fold hydrolase [Leptolyngbyaceae cyanobacterium bins.349]